MEIDSQSSNTYKPLDLHTNEIRILRLKSRQYNRDNEQDEERIICFLEPAFLSNTASIEYTALSYVWENGFPPQKILLSGTEHSISANLSDALQELRKESEDIILWADQLCINQNDQAEKASQVQKMGSIYQKAKQVIAWLGTSADESDLVFTTLRQIERHSTLSSQTSILSEILREVGQDQIWDHNEILDTLKTALPSFAARSYWSRLWVLQEYVLATNLLIQAGSQTILSSTFKTSWNILGRTANAQYGTTPKSIDLIAISETWRKNSTLWFDAWLGIKRFISQREDYHQLPLHRNTQAQFILDHDLFTIMYKSLTTFSGQIQFSCSDPRDRIFSLLGLATDVQEFNHFPDYTKSAERTFEELARNFIEQGHIDIFAFCQENPDSRKRTDIASWAADWSLKIRIPLWGKVLGDVSHGWDADLAPSFSEDKKMIVVNGTCIGKIQAHGSKWGGDTSKPLTVKQMQVFLHQLRGFCERSERVRVEDEEGVCARMAAPAALAYFQGDERLMLVNFRAVFEQLWDVMDVEEDEEEGGVVEFESTYEREVRLQFLRCPFITGNGYVGLAAPWIREGDLVVIFPGGRAPYVLRPEGGGNRFMVVGEAFVNGIMNGEYFKRKREAREFALV